VSARFVKVRDQLHRIMHMLISRWRHRRCSRMRQYRALPGVRGKGIASRTLESPVT
jgi:hypothetical protein